MQCFVIVWVVVSFITLLLESEINPIPERKLLEFFLKPFAASTVRMNKKTLQRLAIPQVA